MAYIEDHFSNLSNPTSRSLWRNASLWGVMAIQFVMFRVDAMELQSSLDRSQVATMPQNCPRAIQDTQAFVSFFQRTLVEMAALHGSQAPRIQELYTVWALREDLENRYRSVSLDNPLDKLIVAQMCHYYRGAQGPDGTDTLVRSDEKPLHQHLMQLSGALLLDATKITELNLKRERSDHERQQWLQKRHAEIQRAKRLGQERAQKIIRGL